MNRLSLLGVPLLLVMLLSGCSFPPGPSCQSDTQAHPGVGDRFRLDEGEVDALWRFEIDHDRLLYVHSHEGRLVVLCDGHPVHVEPVLFGLDAENGTQTWSIHNHVFYDALFSGDEIIESFGRYIIGFDTDTGREVWRVEQDTYSPQPRARVDQVLYITLDDREEDPVLLAWDLAAQSELWRFDGGGRFHDLALYEDLAVIKDNLILRVLRQSDGAAVHRIGGPGEEVRLFQISNDRVVTWNEDRIVGHDLESGQEVWFSEHTEHPMQKTLLAAQDKVYTAGNHTLYATDTQNGEDLWKTRFDETGVTVAGEHDGVLHVSTKNAVYALDPSDGSRMWRMTKRPDESLETIADGLLVIMGNNEVHALDVRPG